MRTFGTFDRNRNIHLTINDHLTRVHYCCVIAGLRSNPPSENITIGILSEVRQGWDLIGHYKPALGSHWFSGSKLRVTQSYHHPFLSRLTSPVLCNVMFPNAGQLAGGTQLLLKM